MKTLADRIPWYRNSRSSALDVLLKGDGKRSPGRRRCAGISLRKAVFDAGHMEPEQGCGGLVPSLCMTQPFC